LARVKVGWVEQLGVFVALAPLAVGEGVHAKVGKGDELMPLPGQLLRAGRREGVGGKGLRRAEADGADEQSEGGESIDEDRWSVHKHRA
jgi:hypothetical protein